MVVPNNHGFSYQKWSFWGVLGVPGKTHIGVQGIIWVFPWMVVPNNHKFSYQKWSFCGVLRGPGNTHIGVQVIIWVFPWMVVPNNHKFSYHIGVQGIIRVFPYMVVPNNHKFFYQKWSFWGVLGVPGNTHIGVQGIIWVWWYPATIGFLPKVIILGCFGGTRKHPYRGSGDYMGVSLHGGTQQSWVFLQ